MIRVLMLSLSLVLFFETPVYAGAAVAKAKGGGPPKRPAMPQQLPPGYVMTPEGVKKIEQVVVLPEEPAEVKDIVDMEQLTASLQTSSEAWPLIISKDDKAIMVEEFIQQYADQGVTIKKPASFYVAMIDQMSSGNSDMLVMPFERVLQVVAVMEYDFGNGQNPDLLAQKILGPQVYEKNRQRLMNQAQK